MPAGAFHTVSTQSISILREERQRKDVGDVRDLIESIRRVGLIHPIVITRDNILVVGERRLTACRQLGWDTIPIQYEDEADPRILKLVELEENVRRRDLSWQEINDAMADAYAVHKEVDPEATTEQIAARIGVDRTTVTEHLRVKREREANPRVAAAATFKTARDLTVAAQQRRESAELSTIYADGRSTHIYEPIQHANFHEWAPTYDGPKFDVIHCDFPYGIDSQDSGANPSGYDDSERSFLECCTTLSKHLDKFCAEQAHMIFWYSESKRATTSAALSYIARDFGFVFDDMALIWHKSDGRGIAPDPSRRPRRVYETAFFGWRGDRKLVELRNNLVAVPSSGSIHPHEKAELALCHFLGMVVDRHTSVFDPTCGSGSALRAAKKLGARHVLGLEADENYAREALAEFKAEFP